MLSWFAHRANAAEWCWLYKPMCRRQYHARGAPHRRNCALHGLRQGAKSAFISGAILLSCAACQQSASVVSYSAWAARHSASPCAKAAYAAAFGQAAAVTLRRFGGRQLDHLIQRRAHCPKRRPPRRPPKAQNTACDKAPPRPKAYRLPANSYAPPARAHCRNSTSPEDVPHSPIVCHVS